MTIRTGSHPSTPGAGVLNIKTNELPTGEYIYTLLVDGKVIDSKKMLMTK